MTNLSRRAVLLSQVTLARAFGRVEIEGAQVVMTLPP
jgi:hypothetical protein